MTRTVVVTGTGTDIGKTVATAGLAVAAHAAGRRVGICKPVQTGLAPGEPGDAHEVAELSGVTPVLEVRRLAEPLAPETAARRSGEPAPTRDELADAIRRWSAGPGPASAPHGTAPDVPLDVALDVAQDVPLDVALVEGAGGVLVRLGTDLTVLDLARELDAVVVVVTRAGLGTLSDTELAVRAVTDAGVTCAGVVIGALDPEPDLATRCNLEDLPRLTGVPLLGAVPAGAGAMPPDRFRRDAPGWFAPWDRIELR